MLKRNAVSWLQGCHERLTSPDENKKRERFTMLLHRHRAGVVQFLYRMMQDGTLAEDLAVEVFLQHFSVGASSPAGQSAIGLFRMATELALREPRNPMSMMAPEQSGDVLDVGRVIACMPGKQRAAVLMHKYHQMDCWQIAKVLNCSESMAKSLLLSAYENLRRLVTAAASQNEELAWRSMQTTLLDEQLRSGPRIATQIGSGNGAGHAEPQ